MEGLDERIRIVLDSYRHTHNDYDSETGEFKEGPEEYIKQIKAIFSGDIQKKDNYLIHLLRKQAAIIGLNEQDKEFLKEKGGKDGRKI